MLPCLCACRGGEPPQQPTQPQYANYWAAPLTPKRHIIPHPAQPRHTNYWAPRMRKRHQQEHRPQRPTESSDPTQHAKGRTGDCPGPRKETTTRRNVTQGEGGRTGRGRRARHAGSGVAGGPACRCRDHCLAPCRHTRCPGTRPPRSLGVSAASDLAPETPTGMDLLTPTAVASLSVLPGDTQVCAAA